jgi:centromeric protein E
LGVQIRLKLEEERRALASFVSKFDSLGLALPPSKLQPPMPMQGGATAAFERRQQNRSHAVSGTLGVIEDSPVRIPLGAQPSLLEQTPEEEWVTMDDMSFEMEAAVGVNGKGRGMSVSGVRKMGNVLKEVLGGKENLPV